MSPEDIKAIEAKKAVMLARMRFNNQIAAAWHSIATERGYRFDTFMGRSSHLTIASQFTFRAKGL